MTHLLLRGNGGNGDKSGFRRNRTYPHFRWVARQLTEQGVGPDRIQELLDAWYGADYRAAQGERWRNRVIGLVLFLLGVALNVWTLFCLESSIVISGLFWAVMLVGLAILVFPDAIGNCLKTLTGQRDRRP